MSSKKKYVSILGSTGSIGTSTLNVIKSNENKFCVFSLSSKDNVNLLTKQCKIYKPRFVSIQNKNKYTELKNNLFGSKIKIFAGDDGILELTNNYVDIVVAAIVGIAGLKPTFNFIKKCKRLCLANKECLVSAGNFFMKNIKKYKCELIPLDSEHNAIFQLCNFEKEKTIDSITLTASGGPFRNYSLKKLKKASLKNALNHPNWKMGNKITIDSATMMNKAFEIIEAFHLFNLKLNQIKVVVHPESIIHSLVNFKDGSTTALLCDHDMRIPIFYALYWPSRESFNVKKIDLFKIRNLSFEKPNIHLIDSINLAYYVLKKGGSYSLIFNAANEVAVKFFLKQKIKFMDIIKIVKKIISISKKHSINNLEDIYSVDKYIRELTEDYIFKTYGNCN